METLTSQRHEVDGLEGGQKALIGMLLAQDQVTRDDDNKIIMAQLVKLNICRVNGPTCQFAHPIVRAAAILANQANPVQFGNIVLSALSQAQLNAITAYNAL